VSSKQTTVAEFASRVVLGSAQGRIALAASLLCLAWGISLFQDVPMVPQPNAKVQFAALGFVLMPVVLATLLVRFSFPTASPAWLTSVILVAVAGLPFYVAYFR
jgi:hypothetical protein